MPEVSQAEDVVIRVLDGPGATADFGFGEVGLILLSGRALPHPGVSYEGKQRIVTSWYQGSPSATQQFIGPEESPTTLSGRWSDRYLGDAASGTGGLGAARLLFERLDRVRQNGSSVRVSWSSFVRIGALARMKVTPERPQDIVWEIEFSWRARDAAPAIRAFPATADSATTAVRLGALAQRVASAFNAALPLILPPLTIQLDLDALTNIATLELAAKLAPVTAAYRNSVRGSMEDVLVRAADFSALVLVLPATPTGAELRRAAQAARAMATTAFADADGLARRSVLDDTFKDDLDDAISYELLRRQLTRSLSELAALAVSQAEAWEEAAEPQVLAEVMIRQGDDLRAVAIRYYGTADLWTLIAWYNELSTSAPAIGTRVLVPRADLPGQVQPEAV